MVSRKKPTKLRALEGNRSKRPLPKDEPQPRPVAPVCPGQLDAGAKKAWKRLGPILERAGLLTEADGEAFAIVCQTWSRLVAIHKEMAKPEQSLVMLKHTVDGAGNEHIEAKQNPLTVMERLYSNLFRQYAAEFGLTPRGRAGLSVGTAKEKDELEDLLD